MSSISSVRVSPLAYKKLVLHAAKYPSARVLGLLLAASTVSDLVVADALPLSHHWTSLSPVAEVALALATAHASARGLVVVGVYEAPELVAARTPCPHAAKLAEKIASLNGTDALLVLVNNATLLSPHNHSLSAYTVAQTQQKQEPKLKQIQGSAVELNDKDQMSKLQDAVREKREWEKLVDFDDHLENPALDWLENPAISA